MQDSVKSGAGGDQLCYCSGRLSHHDGKCAARPQYPEGFSYDGL